MDRLQLYFISLPGNEVVGRQLLIYLAEFLARGYGRDQRITRLLNTTEVSTELVTQIFLSSYKNRYFLDLPPALPQSGWLRGLTAGRVRQQQTGSPEC